MLSIFKKATLATALAATAATGAIATPAQAHGGDAAGAAIIGGFIGLGIGAAIASDHHHEVVYANAPYGDSCYEDAWGNCYPVNYYYQSGWSYRDGYWWGSDGHRYARPFVYGGGYRGGGYGYRGGGGWRGGEGDHGGDRGGGNWQGQGGGDRGGWQGHGGDGHH